MNKIRFRYQTQEFGDYEIHYRTLRDRQQFNDDSGHAERQGINSAVWPIFAMVWPASEILALLMSDYPIAERRILEVGCGVGLASLLLNQRNADISATDYHPDANDYLQHNVNLNQGRAIPFLHTAWNDEQSSQFGHFDLIIGSDLLYESNRAEDLANFIEHFAKQQCEVIYVDAGRGHVGKFKTAMAALNYTHETLAVRALPDRREPKRIKIHQFLR